jgi:hypothetical protein
MFEITPPQRALRERGASDGEADTRCLPGGPGFFATASAEVTTPRAMRPCPPSFSLAKTKTVSPSAICLPPYIVFCAVNANVFARGSLTSVLIANAMLTVRTEHRLEGYAIWTFTEDHIGNSAQAKGAGELSPGFQPHKR